MSNGTHPGSDLILERHTGGETTPTAGSPTLVQPNQFGLPDDLVRALVHPVLNLANPTMKHFVVGVVADYATRLVRLMNAETQIVAVVEEVLKQFNGTLRVIAFSTDLERHCFSSITIKMEIGGRPLYPDTPRPSNLSGDIRQAIADVLQPLGITPPHIIIPYDYSEANELQEIQREGPTRLPGPIEPMTAGDKTSKGEKLRPIDNFPHE
jgi:hypothetical protein